MSFYLAVIRIPPALVAGIKRLEVRNDLEHIIAAKQPEAFRSSNRNLLERQARPGSNANNSLQNGPCKPGLAFCGFQHLDRVIVEHGPALTSADVEPYITRIRHAFDGCSEPDAID